MKYAKRSGKVGGPNPQKSWIRASTFAIGEAIKSVQLETSGTYSTVMVPIMSAPACG